MGSAIALAFLVLLIGACGDGSTLVPLTPVGSGPPLTPTPMGDSISYLTPAYSGRLEPGQSVPGARLTYLGRRDDAFEIRINDLLAIKRPGDSLFWSGIVAPGVFGNYNLRLSTSIFGGMPVGGPVEMIVFYPQPAEIPTAEVATDVHMSNIVIDYRVPVDHQVPGTTMVYRGVVQQGVGTQTARLAHFEGLSGYPFFASGDSLVWNGRLRDNVTVRYGLRAIAFDDEVIHLVGAGELWIAP